MYFPKYITDMMGKVKYPLGLAGEMKFVLFLHQKKSSHYFLVSSLDGGIS